MSEQQFDYKRICAPIDLIPFDALREEDKLYKAGLEYLGRAAVLYAQTRKVSFAKNIFGIPWESEDDN